ncbi:receptor-like protein 33 [Malania oleifera]|uniref:receptor-like protein 33 n=1 Tax=Malania oleifera TaxID=397392 RepID=UPI0025AE5926|nr:receptor-like protein 33 [Malania oleifera]
MELEVLDLGNNRIVDMFPYWLEYLPKLHVLILQSNKFHCPIGSIGSNLKTQFSLSELCVVDLSSNNFTGHLPLKHFEGWKGMMNVDESKYKLQYISTTAYYQDSMVLTMKGSDFHMEKILTIFTMIDMSNNSFNGKIPKSIGKLKSLRGLNFSHNSLTGDIPTSLGNLTTLEWLDLSSNNLGSEIPKQLASLSTLGVLNLSQNQLFGPIPRSTQFDTFSNSSYSGKLGLCGFPLSKTCRNDNAATPTSFMFQQDDDSHSVSGSFWEAALIGYGFGIVFGLVAGFFIFLIGKPNWFVHIIEGVEKKKVKRLRRSGCK